MLKWLSGSLFILTVFYANAEPNDFFVIPVKTIRFVNKVTQKDIPLNSYSLAFETKFNCSDPNCHIFTGNSSSHSEISNGGDILKTLETRIPRMPNSGHLTLTFSIQGVCKGLSKCANSMSFEDFVNATEPVIFTLDYDEKASIAEKKKMQEAEAKSIAEIEEKMGKKRVVSGLSMSGDHWKKFETDFIENRKKLNPMTYTQVTVEKLGLNPWMCSKNLPEKIDKCEFHICIYQHDEKGFKNISDLIVHGFNKAGNCAISTPGGKRFFVPKTELSFFFSAFLANPNLTTLQSDPCAAVSDNSACREKKMDLLFQLSSRHLITDYSPIKIGFLDEK